MYYWITQGVLVFLYLFSLTRQIPYPTTSSRLIRIFLTSHQLIVNNNQKISTFCLNITFLFIRNAILQIFFGKSICDDHSYGINFLYKIQMCSS